MHSPPRKGRKELELQRFAMRRPVLIILNIYFLVMKYLVNGSAPVHVLTKHRQFLHQGNNDGLDRRLMSSHRQPM